MAGQKYVKIIDNQKTIILNEEIERLYFLDFEEEDPQNEEEFKEIKGTDGSIPSSTLYKPYTLSLRFAYVGQSVKDYHLFKHRLRGIIYKREPYYIVHSDMPGKKYAVVPDSISYDDKFPSSGEITIKFVVYKGYSESLKDTSEFSLSSGDWQFGAIARADDSIKYVHTSDFFDIYNGSSDTIDPLLRHKLQIQIKADAPNGITIRNLTTEDKFVYKKPLTPGKTLTIQGVHPLLDGNRVGIDTNWQWITLAPGYNAIKIEDESVKSVETQWRFNFIYK